MASVTASVVRSPLSSESEEELFEVENILGKRTRNGKVEYLIHWRGFGKEEDSWEPVKNLKGCQPLIKNFNKTRSPSPGRKAKTPKKPQAIQQVQTTTPVVKEYTKLKTPTTQSSDYVILRSRKGPLPYKQEAKEEKEVVVTTKTETVEEIKVRKNESIVKEEPSKALPVTEATSVAISARKEVLKVLAAVVVLTFFILLLFSFVRVVGDV